MALYEVCPERELKKKTGREVKRSGKRGEKNMGRCKTMLSAWAVESRGGGKEDS